MFMLVSMTLTLTFKTFERLVLPVFTFTSYSTDVSQPSITSLPTDSCVMTSRNTCVVREGQRVHVTCSADTNPPIDTAAWQPSGDSVLDLLADRNTSVSHVCNIATQTVGNDDRLPRRGTGTLTILPTCECLVTVSYTTSVTLTTCECLVTVSYTTSNCHTGHTDHI